MCSVVFVKNAAYPKRALGFESGYHRTYISLLERGQKSPSLQTIFNLSKALKIEPAELIKLVESETHELSPETKMTGI